MDTITRIRELAKSEDITLNSICRKIGKSSSYFADKARTGSEIPSDVLALIAERLNTTVEYLKGETDDAGQKNIPPSEENGMLAMFQEKFKLLSPENQVLGMAYILKLKESQDKQTD